MSIAQVIKDHITEDKGKPELIVNGKKTVPLWYALSTFPAANPWKDCSQNGVKNFADCGIDIVCVCTNLYEGWQENGEYNPESLYDSIRAVITANPNAKIITRLQLNAPYWWLRKYPEEQMKFFRRKEIDGKMQYVEVQNTDRGTYGDYIFDRSIPVEELKASMASERFLYDCGEMIKQLCKKVKSHSLGQYLIGIQVAYGNCGEWHCWGGPEGDYSKPMQKLFKKIIKERYKTEKELQRFYGVGATFEGVELSSPQERIEAYESANPCLMPEKHARIIDSLRTYSVASAEAIRYFCKCIKETETNLLAGAFYGYFFEAEWVYSAHLETKRVYEDNNVDFLAGPSGYTVNKMAGNANILRHVAESCRLNGKLFLCEMDQGFSANMSGGGGKQIYTCKTEQEYDKIVKRNIMENILLGNGAWYFDHRISANYCLYEKEGYWNQPDRLNTVSQIQKACEKIQAKEYKKTTDVLVVVDTERLYYKGGESAPVAFVQALLKSGAGVDRIFLADLEKCDIEHYKCVLFLHCIALDKRTYEYVCNKVLAGGRTVVFTNDFALIVDNATALGNFEKILGTKRTGQYREYSKENCVICDMPKLIKDKDFYHDLFKRAGAHIYTDNGEVVIADNEMVMMHCKDTPKTVLHLHCGDVEIENGEVNTVIYNTCTGERIL